MAITVTDYRPTLCGILGNLQLQRIDSPTHWARPAQGQRRQRIEAELPRCPNYQKFNPKYHQDHTEKLSNSFPCVTVSSWCLHSGTWEIFSWWQVMKAGHSTGLWLQGPGGHTYLGARTGAHTAQPHTAANTRGAFSILNSLCRHWALLCSWNPPWCFGTHLPLRLLLQ